MKLQLATSLALLCPLAPGQVESLGGLSGADVRPWTISDDGSRIVGGIWNSMNGLLNVVVWDRGEPVRLLDPLLTFRYAAYDMSADGTVLAGSRYLDNSGYFAVATRWDATTGQRTDLDYLPGDDFSYADHVSRDGTVLVGVSTGSTSGGQRAFRWTAAGGMQEIPGLGGPDTRIYGVNRDGTTLVGGSQMHWATGLRAIIWKPSTGTFRVPGLADVYSNADDVSDGGRVVVGVTQDPAIPSKAFYYREGVGTREIHLNGGLYNSPPMIVSGDGRTVVGTVWFQGVGRRGFVWHDTDGMTLISPMREVNPTSVSHDGTVVTGIRWDPATGLRRPVRWTAAGGLEILDDISSGLAGAQSVVVSADGSTIAGYGSGSTSNDHVLVWRGDGTIGEGYCAATTPNSVGQFAELTLAGSNWVGDTGLTMRADGLPGHVLGFFLVGTAPGFVSSVPASQGTLCLGGVIGRFALPAQIQQASAAGQFELTVDPQALPGPNGPFTPGYEQKLYFQAWYRDANPTPTSNFTSASAVRFHM